MGGVCTDGPCAPGTCMEPRAWRDQAPVICQAQLSTVLPPCAGGAAGSQGAWGPGGARLLPEPG